MSWNCLPHTKLLLSRPDWYEGRNTNTCSCLRADKDEEGVGAGDCFKERDNRRRRFNACNLRRRRLDTKIIDIFKKTRFGEQIRIIAVNGIGFAGLNIIDVEKIERTTGAKVLSVTRKRPHPSELVKALKAFSKVTHKDMKKRLALMSELKELPIYKVGNYHVQTKLEHHEAKMFTETAAQLLRLSHMIASGVVLGESKGRV